MPLPPTLMFYDIECTIPRHKGDNVDIIEFAAIFVDSATLNEIGEPFHTMLFSDRISDRSMAANNITAAMVEKAPGFEDMAHRIFNVMNGQFWVGHNIRSYDNRIIEESFQRLGMKGPLNIGIIDTLALTRGCFNNIAGSNALAKLAAHFGLREETHRALDDARLNLEVVKLMLRPQIILDAFKEVPSKPREPEDEPAQKKAKLCYVQEMHPAEKWVPERADLTGKAAEAYHLFKEGTALTTIEAKLKVKMSTISGYILKGFANEAISSESSIFTNWKDLGIEMEKEQLCFTRLIPLQKRLEELKKPLEDERDSIMTEYDISWDLVKFCRLKELFTCSLSAVSDSAV